MIKFDLERALAGDKIITRDGREVTQFTSFELNKNSSMYKFAAVVGGDALVRFSQWGVSTADTDSLDLFMAPKKLSGFVNIYKSTRISTVFTDLFETRELSDRGGKADGDRIACIDLSQFDEGHGL